MKSIISPANINSSYSIEDKNSIQAQYNKAEIDRETYLERARDCAELTIPTLFPPKSSNAATEYKTPYFTNVSR